jgi:hemolysin-activating ACP:hemolysin acyltransferase
MFEVPKRDGANGSGDIDSGVPPPTAPSTPDNAPQVSLPEAQFAIAFTRIVSVLSKSNPYRKMPLGALEGLIVPMIATGQFAIMEADVNGQRAPVALAFWASVSADVDKRLSDASIAVPKLAPNEWRSGDIVWLLDVVGHPQAATQLISQIQTKSGPLEGRDVRVRKRTESGRMSNSTVRSSADATF